MDIIYIDIFFRRFIMQVLVQILHIIVSVVLIAVVLLQSGKSAGLSGSIAGGAESFFGKNKGRTLDSLLSKWTAIVAIGFVVTSIVLTLILI